MTKTMAEVILRSTLLDLQDSISLAKELEAAGFGLVADAKGEALEEAAAELARLPYVRPDAPGRTEYERVLAVRRGNADAWLKDRAAELRTP